MLLFITYQYVLLSFRKTILSPCPKKEVGNCDKGANSGSSPISKQSCLQFKADVSNLVGKRKSDMYPKTANIIAGVVGALMGLTISSIPGSVHIYLWPSAITHCHNGPEVPIWLFGELARNQN